MKSTIFPIAILLGIMTIFSCKGKEKEKEQANETSNQPQSESTPKNTSSSEPKTYTVTAVPDVATLGKSSEAQVKIKNVKAIELTNPDGAITGTELTYELEVTNKNQIGGSSVYVNPNDFRLELDNGTKISHDNYNTVTADPESTKSSSENRFKLPPGTKPTALSLFFNETRASVKLEMK